MTARPGPARVYCRRLAGLLVLDPNGDQVGRVHDVIVTLRLGHEPPRVLGLAVEVQRRPIFVPISRVTGVESGAVVLSSARLSWRRFAQRPNETRVLAELLDRRVTLLQPHADSTARGQGAAGGGGAPVDSGAASPPGREVTVVDAAIEPTRTGDWVLDQVAVRVGRGRRGEVRTVGWDEVTGFSLPEEGQGAANLLAAFEKLRPADLASLLHDLSRKRRAEVAAALDDERLADVLEELPEDEQVELLGGLAAERAADVLEAMGPDDAADLLGELPADEAERLLRLMEPEEAAPVRRLLVYADDTAGGMMTSEPVVLAPNATVAEALARVREPELSPALAAQVYVVRPPYETPTGRYLGLAHFQRLLREPPSTLVGGVIDVDITPLRPDTPLPEVTRHLASYNLVAAPVLDDAGRLVGVVTVDDVLDHLLPSDWRESQPNPDGEEEMPPGAMSAPPAGDPEPGGRGEVGTAPAAT
ncbi:MULTISPECIES: magnesium transporter MgtE N-terminal domain-containing protein [unclassified Parafrankia]|uniref:magnesium transporter MgtE N-terminal domain-containing protein n=1 Tax=unclassified Parafrankia TaxID=2994368 RepID=UPI000DA59A73|nr:MULTISPECIES: CBS domain-containing protein [unclassified Parafrankia]TCJ40360.1 magnesium transporter [Parafrankia sp. BMG5.11]SQD98745.1 MgtE intracellular region [Parafrankia sp. Ea1.12]